MKIFKYIVLLILLLILFRGCLYRISIKYNKIRIRENSILTDKLIIKKINEQIATKTLEIDEIVELSNNITSKKLSFTFNKVTSNPNMVAKLQKANCIGYSALFNSIANYIIQKQNMTNNYKCTHLVGQLNIFGFNIHHAINNPFLKDHDYNEIQNKLTGEKIYTDPSLYDYTKIKYVTSN